MSWASAQNAWARFDSRDRTQENTKRCLVGNTEMMNVYGLGRLGHPLTRLSRVKSIVHIWFARVGSTNGTRASERNRLTWRRRIARPLFPLEPIRTLMIHHRLRHAYADIRLIWWCTANSTP
jgi:hypothetical protein